MLSRRAQERLNTYLQTYAIPESEWGMVLERIKSMPADMPDYEAIDRAVQNVARDRTGTWLESVGTIFSRPEETVKEFGKYAQERGAPGVALDIGSAVVTSPFHVASTLGQAATGGHIQDPGNIAESLLFLVPTARLGKSALSAGTRRAIKPPSPRTKAIARASEVAEPFAAGHEEFVLEALASGAFEAGASLLERGARKAISAPTPDVPPEPGVPTGGSTEVKPAPTDPPTAPVTPTITPSTQPASIPGKVGPGPAVITGKPFLPPQPPKPTTGPGPGVITGKPYTKPGDPPYKPTPTTPTQPTPPTKPDPTPAPAPPETKPEKKPEPPPTPTIEPSPTLNEKAKAIQEIATAQNMEIKSDTQLQQYGSTIVSDARQKAFTGDKSVIDIPMEMLIDDPLDTLMYYASFPNLITHEQSFPYNDIVGMPYDATNILKSHYGITASEMRTLKAMFRKKVDALTYEGPTDLPSVGNFPNVHTFDFNKYDPIMPGLIEAFNQNKKLAKVAKKTKKGKAQSVERRIRGIFTKITDSPEGINVVGQKMSDPLEAIAVAQVARNPNIETMWVFWMDGNEIVQHDTWSIGHFSQIVGARIDELASRSQKLINAGLSIDSMVMVHNHPSGNPTFSGADLQSAYVEFALGRVPLKGFLTVDSGTYSSIWFEGVDPAVVDFNWITDNMQTQQPIPADLLGWNPENMRPLVEGSDDKVFKSILAGDPLFQPPDVDVQQEFASKLGAGTILDDPDADLFAESRKISRIWSKNMYKTGKLEDMLAGFGKFLKTEKGWSTVVFMNHDGIIQAVVDYPDLQNKSKPWQYLEREAYIFGGHEIALYLSDADWYKGAAGDASPDLVYNKLKIDPAYKGAAKTGFRKAKRLGIRAIYAEGFPEGWKLAHHSVSGSIDLWHERAKRTYKPTTFSAGPGPPVEILSGKRGDQMFTEERPASDTIGRIDQVLDEIQDILVGQYPNLSAQTDVLQALMSPRHYLNRLGFAIDAHKRDLAEVTDLPEIPEMSHIKQALVNTHTTHQATSESELNAFTGEALLRYQELVEHLKSGTATEESVRQQIDTLQSVSQSAEQLYHRVRSTTAGRLSPLADEMDFREDDYLAAESADQFVGEHFESKLKGLLKGKPTLTKQTGNPASGAQPQYIRDSILGNMIPWTRSKLKSLQSLYRAGYTKLNAMGEAGLRLKDDLVRHLELLPRMLSSREITRIRPFIEGIEELAKSRARANNENWRSVNQNYKKQVWYYIERNTPLANDELQTVADNFKKEWREILINRANQFLDLRAKEEAKGRGFYIWTRLQQRTPWHPILDGYTWNDKNKTFVHKETEIEYTIEQAYRQADRLWMPREYRRSAFEKWAGDILVQVQRLDNLSEKAAVPGYTKIGGDQYRRDRDNWIAPNRKAAIDDQRAYLMKLYDDYAEQIKIIDGEAPQYWGHLERARETESLDYEPDLDLLITDSIESWKRYGIISTWGQYDPTIGDHPGLVDHFTAVSNFTANAREEAVKTFLDNITEAHEIFPKLKDIRLEHVNATLMILDSLPVIDVNRMNLDQQTLVELEKAGLIAADESGGYVIRSQEAQHNVLGEYLTANARRIHDARGVVEGLAGWTRDNQLSRKDEDQFLRSLGALTTSATITPFSTFRNLLESFLVMSETGGKNAWKGFQDISNDPDMKKYWASLDSRATSHVTGSAQVAGYYSQGSGFQASWLKLVLYTKAEEWSRRLGVAGGGRLAQEAIMKYANDQNRVNREQLTHIMIDPGVIDKFLADGHSAKELPDIFAEHIERVEQDIATIEGLQLPDYKAPKNDYTDLVGDEIRRAANFVSDTIFKQYNAGSLPSWLANRYPMLRLLFKFKAWGAQMHRWLVEAGRRSITEARQGNFTPMIRLITGVSAVGLGGWATRSLFAALSGNPNDDWYSPTHILESMAGSGVLGLMSNLVEFGRYAEGNAYKGMNQIFNFMVGPFGGISGEIGGEILALTGRVRQELFDDVEVDVDPERLPIKLLQRGPVTGQFYRLRGIPQMLGITEPEQ